LFNQTDNYKIFFIYTWMAQYMVHIWLCNFLCLTLKQAIARGLKDPSLRVIQSHFAISANLGEVAAKVNSHVITNK
jgi:hypothetical protein